MTIQISKSSADNLFRIHQLAEALEINARILKDLANAVDARDIKLREETHFHNACAQIEALCQISTNARLNLDRLNKAFQHGDVTCKE